MLETIIDDFAESLNSRDRALFYAHLAELLAERRDGIDRREDGIDEEPKASLPVH